MRKRLLSIGIIGCGAAAEKGHIPALKKIAGVNINAFVDTNLARAKLLRRRFKGAIAASDYRMILDGIDIALIASPNYLHFDQVVTCLEKGVHVFCEKPIATNAKDAQMMVDVAEKKKLKLCIGMVRRYYKVNQKIKQLLHLRSLGRVKTFDYEEGFPFSWPLQTTYAFEKEKAGGGVLIDTGSHVIDLLNYLFGKIRVLKYEDDSYGGVEDNCYFKLSCGDILGKVLLSRNRTLRNTFKIECEKGVIEAPAGGLSELHIKEQGEDEIFAPKQTFDNAYYQELSHFIESVRSNSDSFISGDEVIGSMRVIDYCYKHRQNIDEPWLLNATASSRMSSPKATQLLVEDEEQNRQRRSSNATYKNRSAKQNFSSRSWRKEQTPVLWGSSFKKNFFADKTVFITGASGFIGGRLVERFCFDTKARVKALIHNRNHATRIDRFDIEIITGDILDKKLLFEITKGVDYVIHCAFGKTADPKLNERITVDGTKNILESSLSNRVKCVIYFSTMSVYGYPLHSRCNEQTPTKKVAGDFYNNDKIEAEKVASKYQSRGLPLVILQPTMVYGPYGKIWTTDIVKQIQDEGLFLVNRGEGLANPVYIDNVVDAVFLALNSKRALGEKFIISDGVGVPWRKFFGYYNKLVTGHSLSTLYFLRKYRVFFLSLVVNFVRKTKKVVFPFQIFKTSSHPIRKFMDKYSSEGEKIKNFSSAKNLQLFFSDNCVFEIKKAKTLLGYKPRTPLSKGMRLTGQWLRYAQLI